MRENHGPVHLEEVLRSIKVGAESDSEEMVRDPLALLRPGAPDHVGGDVALYEMGGPEVGHPGEEVEHAVPHGDQGRPAEHDGFTPVSRLGELGEHNPCRQSRAIAPDGKFRCQMRLPAFL